MEQINTGILKLKTFSAGSHVNATKTDFSAKREEPVFDALMGQKNQQARNEVETGRDRKTPVSENETETKEIKTEKAIHSGKEEEMNCDVAREVACAQMVWLMSGNAQEFLVEKQESDVTIEQPMLIVTNDETVSEIGELNIPQIALAAQNTEAAETEQLTLVPETEMVAEEIVEQPAAEIVERPVEQIVEQTAEVVQEIERPQQVETRTVEQNVEREDVAVRVTVDDAEEISGEAAAEAPLFKDVEAAPIKVAEAPERAENRTPAAPVEQQITEKLSNILNGGETRVELQLEPLELGKLTIELTRNADGVLNIVLNAENAQTRTLLERHVSPLQEALSERGQQNVQITVERNDESQRQNNQQNNDFRDGSNGRQHEQQRRENPRSGEDFLQQLRLGLIPIEDEEDE